MQRDVSLSDSKCLNGGHEWVKKRQVGTIILMVQYPCETTLFYMYFVNDSEQPYQNRLNLYSSFFDNLSLWEISYPSFVARDIDFKTTASYLTC